MKRLSSHLLALLVTFAVRPALAQDAIRYRYRFDSRVDLFERATAFGPTGQVVATEVAAPFYQFAWLDVADVDVPWRDDSVDVELALWGNLDAGRTVDGEVTIARVRQRYRYGYVSVGRQFFAAHRAIHFDGIAARIEAPYGVGVDGYAGFAVLPRWSARRGYGTLGSASDTLLRDPTLADDVERSGHWLAGGRAFYRHRAGELGVAFHERREEAELASRDVAFDASLRPWTVLRAQGRAVIDLDSASPSDARATLETRPIDDLDLALSYAYLVPSRFLSRQSVLSVFSHDAFNEVGGDARYRLGWWRLQAEGYLVRLSDGFVGTRSGGSVRVAPSLALKPTALLGYRRVSEAVNGYHALSAGVSLAPHERVLLSSQAYVYRYDAPIRDVRTSWLGSVHGRWALSPLLAVTLGGSLSQSPYASADARAVARVELGGDG